MNDTPHSQRDAADPAAVPGGKRYRFFLVNAFHLPEGSPYVHRPMQGAKETRLMNFENVSALLQDVEWELHPGPLAP